MITEAIAEHLVKRWSSEFETWPDSDQKGIHADIGIWRNTLAYCSQVWALHDYRSLWNSLCTSTD